MALALFVVNVVVPYIGTWIETEGKSLDTVFGYVVPYIGTWIETTNCFTNLRLKCRTLYRYVD